MSALELGSKFAIEIVDTKGGGGATAFILSAPMLIDWFNDIRLALFAGLANMTLLGAPLLVSPMGGESCGIMLDRRFTPFSLRNGPIFDRRLPLGTPEPGVPIFDVEGRFAGLPWAPRSRPLGTCRVFPSEPVESSDVDIWFMFMSDSGC
jgi:hypothetical protein